MPAINLIYLTDKRDGYERVCGLEIYSEGRKIASGRFGGEPEDNSFERDYSWVDEAICATAKALGAEVTSITKPDDD